MKNTSKPMKVTIELVRKRNGRTVPFNPYKIISAIEKSFLATTEGSEKDATRVGKIIRSLLEKKARQYAKQHLGAFVPKIEEIQDLAEAVLMSEGYHETAKAYILYREQHREVRETEESLVKAVHLVDKYIGNLDWLVKENANMAYSLQGLNNYVSSAISTKYWMNKIYSKEVRDAHESGDMHIHDLQLISAYCCGWDLEDLLRRGFTGVPGKVSCKPAKHLGSALGQMVNFIYTLQGEVAGAQAFSNFDTLLAPFIRKDHLTFEQVKQEIQSFVFNMNVSTRVGFQTPFSNITLDLTPPKILANEHVIIGGEPQQETYGEFVSEMAMINRAFAEVMCEGDASGRIFTFPIPTYNITKNFDWENSSYESLWEMTAKYGIPYFANFVNSDMSPDDARSMCPLAGDEKVLIRSSRGRTVEYSAIRNIVEGNSLQENYEIYSNGKFIQGQFNKFPKERMIKVVLENGHEIRMSEKHLNFVLRDEKESVCSGKELTSDMYLPYSLETFEGEGGHPDLGFFVGAYAGDGSFDGETSVVFSLEDHFKKDLIEKLEEIAARHFGAHSTVIKDAKTKLVTLKIHSKAAVGICRDFVEGKEREKHYTARVFTMSRAFRKSVIAGHSATDGGNRHRIYTSSRRMIETLNMLAATLGTTTSIYTDDRSGRFSEHPNYAVLFYQLNRERYGNVWQKKNGKLWVRIKNIVSLSESAAYCFQVQSGEPLFTVGTTGILTHNCRLRLDNRELRRRGGGLFGANPLTGSVGVVTVNLPRIGYLAKNEKDFFARLDRIMDIAKESLETKRKVVEQLTEKGLYPYTKFYLGNIKKRFHEYWRNHFSTIGLIGTNEAIRNFLKTDITTEKGQLFAKKILTHMRDRIADYQKETNNLFNLEATPGEGTAYRLALLDTKRFSDITVANGSEKKTKNAEPYYTNSSHLPVGFTDDIFEALDLQDELQTQYTGGTVLHGFLGERISDTKTARMLVRRIAEKYHLPYFTLTPTFSICPIHGYLSGEQKTCPKCIVMPASNEYKKV